MTIAAMAALAALAAQLVGGPVSSAQASADAATSSCMPQERDEQLAEAQQQVLKLLRPGPLAVSGSDLDRSIINTAAVTAKEADPNTSNNTASARTTVLLFDTFCIA